MLPNTLTGTENVGAYFNNGLSTTHVDAFTMSSVSLICGITELSQSAQMLPDSSLGGGVSFDYEAISVTQDTKEASATAKFSNLGFRYSSLNRIGLIHLDQRINAGSSAYHQFYISNRCSTDLAELRFSIGGVSFPQNLFK